MPWLLYICIFFSDFMCFDMSLLLLTVTLRGVSNKHYLLPLFSFLISSSSFLQVTRTTIRSWTSLKFDQTRPWTAELAALERLEKSQRLIMGEIL